MIGEPGGARGAQLAGYQIRDPLASKALVVALAKHVPEDRGHTICYLSRQHLPTRIRIFVDFMTEQIRALDLNCMTQFNRELTVASSTGLAARSIQGLGGSGRPAGFHRILPLVTIFSSIEATTNHAG